LAPVLGVRQSMLNNMVRLGLAGWQAEAGEPRLTAN